MDSGLENIPASDRPEYFRSRNTVIEDGPGTTMQFSRDFLRTNSKIAVPFTDSYHFHCETARALADACIHYGYEFGYAIPLLDQFGCCYRLRLVASDFGSLNDVNVMPVEFLLLENDRRFAILADYDFNTIAGPQGFVERAIEMTVEEAWQEFNREYVEHEGYSSAIRDGWRELVKYYHTTK